MRQPRLLRITTVPVSIHLLLKDQLPFMSQQGFEVLAVSADGPERSQILAAGVNHVVVPFTRKITPLRDIICLLRLFRVIRKFQPDIIHTHTPKAGMLGMLAGWLAGTPVLLHTIAGLPSMEARGIRKRALDLSEWLTYRCAHAVFANSKGLCAVVENKFPFMKQKLSVLGNGSTNGINTDYFQRSPQLLSVAAELKRTHGIGEEEFVFGFVGRIVTDKGIRELVEAFADIKNQYPVRLMLVGELESDLDPLPPSIRNFLNESTAVIMPGFQEDVRPWMLAMDVFVFPSYREGFPNVLLQACGLEVPCIASDINGCNEILQDGITGMLVPLKNQILLKVAMINMMRDRERMNLMGKRARDFIVSRFDQQVIWSELVHNYRRHLDRVYQNKMP